MTGRGGALILAACTAALGVILLAGTSSISLGSGYDRIGPRFFPYVVGTGLLVLAALVAAASLRPGGGGMARRPSNHDAPAVSWRPLAYIAVALVVYVATLERAGFIPASIVQFWLVARAFRSTHPARDLAAGTVLSIAVYLVFARGLGLTLPPGVFERFL